MSERQTGQEVAQDLERYVNNMSLDYRKNDFIETIVTRTHNTLQQSIVRLMLNTIKGIADQEYHDGRNEAAVKACRFIVRQMKEEYGMIDPLPFI